MFVQAIDIAATGVVIPGLGPAGWGEYDTGVCRRALPMMDIKPLQSLKTVALRRHQKGKVKFKSPPYPQLIIPAVYMDADKIIWSEY